jgi:hypothetical protein
MPDTRMFAKHAKFGMFGKFGKLGTRATEFADCLGQAPH